MPDRTIAIQGIASIKREALAFVVGSKKLNEESNNDESNDVGLMSLVSRLFGWSMVNIPNDGSD